MYGTNLLQRVQFMISLLILSIVTKFLRLININFPKILWNG